jgi:hypothetical protein
MDFVMSAVTAVIELVISAVIRFVETPEGQLQLDKLLTAVGLPNIIPGDPNERQRASESTPSKPATPANQRV